MTFDDGPSEKLTPELLDILAPHHIHATFFVIGENAVSIRKFSSAPCAKVTRSATTAGRIPLSRKCPMRRCGANCKKPTTRFARDRRSPGLDAAALRLDHRPAETMDPRRIWLTHHSLGRRSARLEAAGPGGRDESHRQGNAPGLDHSLARHSSRHDQGHAGDLRQTAGQGLQIRHRLRVDRDGKADGAEGNRLGRSNPACLSGEQPCRTTSPAPGLTNP